MQNEELIEYITREVLKKLEGKVADSSREKLLLTEAVGLNLSAKLKLKYEISVFEELEKKIDLAEFKNLIITKLDTKLLIEVAELIQINRQAELILNLLFQAKKVYLIREGISYYQYQSQCTKILYDKIMAAERKLKSFGIEFLTAAELERKLNSNFSAAELSFKKTGTDSESQYFLLDKKLIDYSTVKKLYERNCNKIEIPLKSIVTALAEDFIKDKDIKFKYIEGR